MRPGLFGFGLAETIYRSVLNPYDQTNILTCKVIAEKQIFLLMPKPGLHLDGAPAPVQAKRWASGTAEEPAGRQGNLPPSWAPILFRSAGSWGKANPVGTALISQAEPKGQDRLVGGGNWSSRRYHVSLCKCCHPAGSERTG